MEIVNITKNTPQHFHLLEEAYREIFIPAFPDPDERESLQQIMEAIHEKVPNLVMAVNILGENLNDPQKAVVKGIGIAEYYEDASVGLLAYNAIDPKYREKGMGKILVQSRIDTMKKFAKERGKKLRGVFIDVRDPSKATPAKGDFDPQLRVDIFTKWGAKKVPMDYVMPPLNKSSDYCDTMMLMNYPVDGLYAEKDAIRDCLSAMYRRCNIKQPEQDYFFRRMAKQLDQADYKPAAKKVVPGYAVGAPKFSFVR